MAMGSIADISEAPEFICCHHCGKMLQEEIDMLCHERQGWPDLQHVPVDPAGADQHTPLTQSVHHMQPQPAVGSLATARFDEVGADE